MAGAGAGNRYRSTKCRPATGQSTAFRTAATVVAIGSCIELIARSNAASCSESTGHLSYSFPCAPRHSDQSGSLADSGRTCPGEAVVVPPAGDPRLRGGAFLDPGEPLRAVSPDGVSPISLGVGPLRDYRAFGRVRTREPT